MRDTNRNISKWWGRLISPSPSLFDILLSLIVFIPFLPDGYIKEVAFVFYIIFLVCVSYGLRPIRSSSSTWLQCLLIWSLVCLFIHSFNVSEHSITRKYVNFYLLSEGFLYILCGCLYIRTFIDYSKNTRFIWFIVPIGLYPMLNGYIAGGRITPIAAIVLSTIIYFIINRKWWFLFLTLPGIIIVTVWHWNYICFKFASRPEVWKLLLNKIMIHPIVGSGFNHGLSYDNMVFMNNKNDTALHGWVYNHNDFLSLASYLGIPALLFIIMFCIMHLSLSRGKVFIITLSLILICMFQMTMFDINKAVIVLVLVPLIILHNWEVKNA